MMSGTWWNPVRNARRCLSSSYPGILLEPIESLVAPKFRFNPIQRSLLCQAGADRHRGFAAAFGDVRNLRFDLFFRRFDFFRGRNVVQQQLRLDVLDGAVARCRWRIAYPSTFTARGSTPCAASVRTARSRRVSI